MSRFTHRSRARAAGSCELSRKAVDIWAGAYGSEARGCDVGKKSYGKRQESCNVWLVDLGLLHGYTMVIPHVSGKIGTLYY